MKTIQRQPKHNEWYTMPNEMRAYCQYARGKMMVNGGSTLFGLACWVIWVAIGRRHSYIGIGRLHRKKRKRHTPCPIMKMSINGASTIVRLSTWVTQAWCGRYCLYTNFWLFSYATTLMNSELQHCKWNELLLCRRLSQECLLLICLKRLPTPPW